MKGFLVVCNCNGKHDEANKKCPVEQMMFLILSHGFEKHIHDVLDVQPVFGGHEDVVE